MESYEKRSNDAEAEADRMEEEAERVGRRIEEAKSDWQSKQGQVPGMEPGDPARPDVPGEAEETAEDTDAPNKTTLD